MAQSSGQAMAADPSDLIPDQATPISDHAVHTEWPESLALTSEMRGFAESRGMDAALEFEMWKDDCLAHGRRNADWQAAWLAARSAGFRRSLPMGVVAALADLVRSMNCYYSNLIEGHDTHPVDLEWALKNDYSADVRKRNLQIEAKAHIEVQQWIDAGGLLRRATTRAGVCEIHRRFCEKLPEELLSVENPETGERMPVVPGELRRRDVGAT